MNRINIRDFNRNMYQHIKKLPLIVFNTKTDEDLFIVKKLGGESVEVRTKSSRK